MTTVTEAGKRLDSDEDADAIQDGDLQRVCADRQLARRFARRLTEVARELAPARNWSVEDLRDVFEVAVRGPLHERAQVLEGGQFRARLRDHGNIAQRYGEPLACIVLFLEEARGSAVYSSVLDAVTENLRSSDMVFLYKRRLALLLPRMRAEGVEPFVERVRELLAVGPGEDAMSDVTAIAYPHEDVPHFGVVLEWAEDQLREV
jgi:hypothetical protein